MRLLLDTHILLWRLTNSTRLSADALRLIDEEADALFASAASVWEVSIKRSVRKQGSEDAPFSGSEFLSALEAVGIDFLPITPAHAAAIDLLPSVHRDPFDRILIAQARCEGLTLLTSDAQLGEYGANVMVV